MGAKIRFGEGNPKLPLPRVRPEASRQHTQPIGIEVSESSHGTDRVLSRKMPAPSPRRLSDVLYHLRPLEAKLILKTSQARGRVDVVHPNLRSKSTQD